MPSPYRALFAAPGSKGFSAAGFLGRMPLSMMGIGVVTMISQLTGRYGLAGALSATIALSAAALGPQISRLVDRHGQRRVLRPATLFALTAAAALLLAAHYDWPDWVLFVCSAGIGCVPSLGAMTRARWANLYRDTPQLHTAYAFESVVDEVCFIFGPIISIGVSTVWFPEAGPLLAAVFLALGVFWLTAQRATEPEPHPHEQHSGGSALRAAGLQVLVATFVATGAIFGAVDVVTVAFAEEQGHKAAASVVLALYAAGSCVAGVVFGLLRFTGAAERRWLLGICAMAVSMIPLLLVGNLPFLAVALFVAGLSIAPTMITTMSLIEQHVPRAKLTEGMTWVSTGLAVGIALGSSVSGWVIDAAGARAGYGVPAVSGAVAVAVGFLGYRRLSRPAPQRGGSHEHHSEREERHVA
ncbi:MFS transporter [Streptomyces avermitilis]|uniref:Transmembrane efflux protein n=2 Tax=Streptomyces avermitilis TaxID=33903 RepID=Q82KJ5_STRAW|nr:MFS transporter [Streptomyces avermitilis]MYS98014.1 MFS transporter [Streptomyces sp. SID5469]KUN50569.1 MFS transporter [Streptomyces avermitilis]OOV24399.1 MFS transporter [Streptomyces avermitilis]BAC70119.1 putative transmembrane efflux protein [Streptomyces avermitilis MA-4680 = NBRC 14893]GDY62215.1 MFS transporter [Streptomyces avermitilis]